METRRKRKKANKRNWYDRTKYDGVMFVGVTPNSEMKNRIQDACRKNKLKIKVVEKMNCTVKNTLQRSNPYGWRHCGRHDCPTCNRDIHINCRTRGVVYEIECKVCKDTITKQYTGQTGRSVYERMKEHFREWEAKSGDSHLHKHSTKCHGGDAFDVDIRIRSQCYGRPSTRLITEAVQIEELPNENTMNSKSEWTYVKLPRVAVA